MAFTVRKFILHAFLTFILLHEPVLKILINRPVNANVFSRISLDIIRTLVDAQFLAVAHITATVFNDLRALIAQRYEWVISTLASLIHIGLVHLVRWAIVWLNESPRWLYKLNEIIVDTAKDTAWSLHDHSDEEIVENWLAAGETVVHFCADVRGRYF